MTQKLPPEVKQARALERERARQRKQDEKDRLKKGDRYPVWTTDDELSYLRKIGSHTIYTLPFTKVQLLEKYLESMKSRVHWGHIDPEKVSEYIKKSIRLIKDKLYKESLKRPKVR